VVGLLLRRAMMALLAAALTMAALVVLTAWAALRVSWAVPDPGASAGPTELLDRHGTVIARFTAEIDRELVDLDAVSEVAQDAVVVAEDSRFYEHGGVDPLSLVRAVVTNVRTGGIAQGGSTLTQQYVKSAFVGDERTILRKVREAVIAIQLERDVSKDEILERYLNEVYFGQGAYGIEAASQTYFGVPASDLDAAQGATLAQLLPAPSMRNPVADPEGARERRDALLERMAEQGLLDDAEAADARASELEITPSRGVETRAPAFTDHVRRQLEHAFGDDVMLTGALTVRTSLDLGAQEVLDRVAAERLPGDEAGDVEAGMVALDPRTGKVLAMHGGRDMGVGDFNLATMIRRQNGSAFKPFVLAAALEEGVVQPDTTRPSPSRTTISSCVGHDGGPITVRGGPGGSATVSEALVHSVNTTYQALGCEVGGERILEQARRMGVRTEIPPTASIALGGASHGASPLDMAVAFGTFANDGSYCPPRTVLEITGPSGEDVDVPPEVVIVPDQPRAPRVWSQDEVNEHPEWLVELAESAEGRCDPATHPSIARGVNAAMQGVVERGTGSRADIGRPQAGKTGTSQENKDAWYVGYTPQLSLSVWIGSPGDNASLPPLGGFSQVFGGTLPAVMWADAAGAILADVDPEPFPEPIPIDLDVPDEGPQVSPARQIPSQEPQQRTTPRDTGEPDADEPDEGEDPDESDETDEVDEVDEEPPEEDGDPGEDPAEPPDGEDDEDEGSCLLFCD
jgi:penicillin-binding protein 1A